jgi:hypothetical protein
MYRSCQPLKHRGELLCCFRILIGQTIHHGIDFGGTCAAMLEHSPRIGFGSLERLLD